MKLYPSLGTATNANTAVELDCNIVKTIGKYLSFGGSKLIFVEVDKPMMIKIDGKEVETYTGLLAN
jgi:hypothetical protein